MPLLRGEKFLTALFCTQPESTPCSWRGLQWHVDETYVRVNGRWCYLWRAVDQRGQLIDFRLTARRNANAARAFMRQASDTVRCYHPLTIITDKAHSYA